MAISKSLRMIIQIITPGVMIAASIIMARALAPVEQSIGNWRNVVSARQSYRRMQELLEEISDLPNRMRLPGPAGQVNAERLVGVPPGGQAAVLKGGQLRDRGWRRGRRDQPDQCRQADSGPLAGRHL